MQGCCGDEDEERPALRKNGVKKEKVKEVKKDPKKEGKTTVKKEGAKKIKEEKSQVKAEKKFPVVKVKATSKDSTRSSSSTSKSKAKASAPTLRSSGHWEPSPPPPTKVEQYVQGKNVYTKEDIDYSKDYVRILLHRDPSMSVNAIATKLHEKACCLTQN